MSSSNGGAAANLRQRAPRLAEAAVERARLSVVPRARTRAARVPFVSLVSLLLLGGVIGLLVFNTAMQQSSFTATSLEQRATLLSARQESLGMELESLRDPQVIARRAQQLGMRVPAAPLFLDLSDGSVEGDPVGARVVTPVLLDPRPPARPAELDPPTTVVRPPEGTLNAGNGNGNGTGRQDEQGRDQRGAAERSDRGGRNAFSGQRDDRTDRPGRTKDEKNENTSDR